MKIHSSKTVLRRVSITAMALVLMGAGLFNPLQIVKAAYAPIQSVSANQLSDVDTHGCLIYEGRAYCWGLADGGRLGTGYQGGAEYSPVPVDLNTGLYGKTVQKIVTSSSGTCAIADDQLYCWGQNMYGQVGNGTTENALSPAAVDTSGVLGSKTITDVSLSYYSACAIADGQPYCWGDNQFGQLGDGTTVSSSVPVPVDTNGVLAGKTVTSISSGETAVCVLADGAPYCWGRNVFGELGNGTTNGSSIPVAVNVSGVLMGRTIQKIELGGTTSCVIADGAPYCWGSNIYGQFGNGTLNNSAVPTGTDVSGALSGRAVSDISLSGTTICAIADSLAFCWGSNYAGQVGVTQNYETFDYITAPIAVDSSGLLNGVELDRIAVSGRLTCASSVDGFVYCWGQDTFGIRGNGGYGPEFEYQVSAISTVAPEISSITPSSIGTNTGVAIVSINGSSFQDSAQVTVDGQPVTVISRNPWQIEFQLDTFEAEPGLRDVTVTQALGASATFTDAISVKVLEPEISFVSPYAAEIDGTNHEITIYGSEFDSGARVWFDDIEMTVSSRSDTAIVVTVPTAGREPGAVDVTVRNANGNEAIKEDAFEFVPEAPVAITGHQFIDLSNGRALRLIGTKLLRGYDGIELNAFTRDYVYLNGTPLVICSKGLFNMTADEFIAAYEPILGVELDGRVTDNRPCLMYAILDDPDAQAVLLTDSSLTLFLPEGFNEAASGVVQLGTILSYNFGTSPETPIPTEEIKTPSQIPTLSSELKRKLLANAPESYQENKDEVGSESKGDTDSDYKTDEFKRPAVSFVDEEKSVGEKPLLVRAVEFISNPVVAGIAAVVGVVGVGSWLWLAGVRRPF